MFEDLIGVIKLWSKLLVVVVFDRGLFIRLQMKEHIIPFFKTVLGAMLIDQTIFESAKNVSPSCEVFVDLLYLRDSW
jgi:hypothetical protein